MTKLQSLFRILFVTATLLIPNYQLAMESNSDNSAHQAPLVCYNCLDPETNKDNSTTPKLTLSCGHVFCVECLNRTVEEAIDSNSLPKCRHNEHIKIDEAKKKAFLLAKKTNPKLKPDYKTEIVHHLTLADIRTITQDKNKVDRIEKMRTGQTTPQPTTHQTMNNTTLENNNLSGAAGKQENVQRECTLCGVNHLETEYLALLCKHTFCKTSLNGILDAAIGQSQLPRCPHADCMKAKESVINPTDFKRITTDPKKLKRLDKIQIQKGLATDPNARCCPAPDCTYSFIHRPQNKQRIRCDLCKMRFCSDCLLDHDYRVITCQEFKQTFNKSEADQKSEQEIKKITKVCPRPSCKVSIQRNDGCNHMTCTQCKHEWCWVCLRNWSEHGHHTGGYYRCNLPNNNPNNGINGNNQPAQPIGGQQPAYPQPQEFEEEPWVPLQNVWDIPINPQPRPQAHRPAMGGYQPNEYLIAAQNHYEFNNYYMRYENLTNEQRNELENNVREFGLPETNENAEFNARLRVRQLRHIENNGGPHGPQGPDGKDRGNGGNKNRTQRSFLKNPIQYLTNSFNPLYLLAAVPPVLVALRIRQWVKYPTAIKTAISTLNTLIETAESDEAHNLMGQLNLNQHKLTIGNEKIAQLREYALRDQYKEFAVFATQCRQELQDMTATNAGFANGYKKVRWGLSADLINAKQWFLTKMGRV